jgi:hypothetical protein
MTGGSSISAYYITCLDQGPDKSCEKTYFITAFAAALKHFLEKKSGEADGEIIIAEKLL